MFIFTGKITPIPIVDAWPFHPITLEGSMALLLIATEAGALVCGRAPPSWAHLTETGPTNTLVCRLSSAE